MGLRYNHWFWNSKVLNWVSKTNSRFGGWLWRKQYDRPESRGA